MASDTHIIKRLFCISCLLLLSYSFCFGQKKLNPLLRLEEWHSGELVLKNGNILKGEINHNYIAKIIGVKIGGKILSHSYIQIVSFKYYETEEEPEHNFRSLRFGELEGIFEIITENSEYAFLSKNEVKFLTHNNPLWTPSGVAGPMSYNVNYKAETFLLVTKEGEVHNIGSLIMRSGKKRKTSSDIRKKKFFELMKTFKTGVFNYVDSNQLNIHERNDLITVFRWMTGSDLQEN